MGQCVCSKAPRGMDGEGGKEGRKHKPGTGTSCCCLHRRPKELAEPILTDCDETSQVWLPQSIYTPNNHTSINAYTTTHTFLDDFTLGSKLGEGISAEVFKCRHRYTHQEFAVKVFEKHNVRSSRVRQMIYNEAEILTMVKHPYIVSLEAAYESNDHVFLVMELRTGGTLVDRLNGRPRFKENEAVSLMRPIIQAVAYLHERLSIVHRDIKPDNILCGDNIFDVKLADFGLAKVLPMGSETTRTPCGTLSYVGPDVLDMGPEGYGKESDMWSVGVILFLVLQGYLPFDGDDKSSVIARTVSGQINIRRNPSAWSSLSVNARDLLLGLLKTNAQERYTAREALDHPFLQNLDSL